ncbi:RICIN domain-containing protein [Kitasatospora cineracea]|uniref:RICIN domain-containing protein n=1 Tax=Kitasatospora cineracea TaxID=88074 RepID=UPI001FCA1F17|nr:RICIN domain-containing protein [Kitasatospora cineracea]
MSAASCARVPIENVHSGKVLEVADAQERAGAPVAPAHLRRRRRAPSHQHWRLIPTGPAADGPGPYEIANHHSSLLLHVGTNAPAALALQAADGHRNRQWQLLPG